MPISHIAALHGLDCRPSVAARTPQSSVPWRPPHGSPMPASQSEIAKGRQGRRRTPNYEIQDGCSAGVRKTFAQAGGALFALLAFFGDLAVRPSRRTAPHARISLHRLSRAMESSQHALRVTRGECEERDLGEAIEADRHEAETNPAIHVQSVCCSTISKSHRPRRWSWSTTSSRASSCGLAARPVGSLGSSGQGRWYRSPQWRVRSGWTRFTSPRARRSSG
jgi:hypothetical protein